MKKRFKKIYVEITNKCNLNCSFCSEIRKKKNEMSIDDFKIVVSKIKDYTNHIYLHIKGEPLIHTNLHEILSICDIEDLNVNITTNGTLLKVKKEILLKHKSIRQINVSLHSENNMKNYFDEVFETCKKLSSKMFINYRLWNLKDNKLDKNSTIIVDKIKKYYNLSTDFVDNIKNNKNVKIDINTFVNISNLFNWPDEKYNLNIDGKCYGLIDHIGILSDGTIVPCCLDSNGIINLGNIFKDNLKDILDSELVNQMICGFRVNKSVHNLCKNCNFRERFRE